MPSAVDFILFLTFVLLTVYSALIIKTIAEVITDFVVGILKLIERRVGK